MLVSVLTVASVASLIAGIGSFLSLRGYSDQTVAICALVSGIAGTLSLLWMAQVLDKLEKIYSSLNPTKDELNKLQTN